MIRQSLKSYPFKLNSLMPPLNGRNCAGRLGCLVGGTTALYPRKRVKLLSRPHIVKAHEPQASAGIVLMSALNPCTIQQTQNSGGLE